MEEEKLLPNSFSKSCIALIPYQTRQFKREGNHRPKAHMNIDARILNEILTNRIKQYIKIIIYHDYAGFIPRMSSHFKIQKSM